MIAYLAVAKLDIASLVMIIQAFALNVTQTSFTTLKVSSVSVMMARL